MDHVTAPVVVIDEQEKLETLRKVKNWLCDGRYFDFRHLKLLDTICERCVGIGEEVHAKNRRIVPLVEALSPGEVAAVRGRRTDGEAPPPDQADAFFCWAEMRDRSDLKERPQVRIQEEQKLREFQAMRYRDENGKMMDWRHLKLGDSVCGSCFLTFASNKQNIFKQVGPESPLNAEELAKARSYTRDGNGSPPTFLDRRFCWGEMCYKNLVKSSMQVVRNVSSLKALWKIGQTRYHDFRQVLLGDTVCRNCRKYARNYAKRLERKAMEVGSDDDDDDGNDDDEEEEEEEEGEEEFDEDLLENEDSDEVFLKNWKRRGKRYDYNEDVDLDLFEKDEQFYCWNEMRFRRDLPEKCLPLSISQLVALAKRPTSKHLKMGDAVCMECRKAAEEEEEEEEGEEEEEEERSPIGIEKSDRRNETENERGDAPPKRLKFEFDFSR
jgi:hypothetical protein